MRGATPADPRGLPDGVLDATDVEATLGHFAEVAGDREGEWVLELVAASEEDCDALGRLLDPLTNGDGADVATYLVAIDAPSSAGRYVVGEGREIRRERGYLTGRLCRMLPPVADDNAPVLFVTPVRIVAQDTFLLVNWMAAGGYPEVPHPRRIEAAVARVRDDDRSRLRWPPNAVPGDPVEAARAAGVAEEVIAFERGPLEGALRRIGKLDGPFDAAPSAPLRLAERLVADLASSMVFASQQCAEALQAWEAAFLSMPGERDPVVPITTPDSFRHLVRIANLVGAVSAWNDELNSPSSHEPLYWFGATSDSERAMRELESADRKLDAARDDYRTALSIAAGIATSQQLELQSRSQEQWQVYERTIALVGSVVLVPGLVATFYGANVPLPAGGTWVGYGFRRGSNGAGRVRDLGGAHPGAIAGGGLVCSRADGSRPLDLASPELLEYSELLRILQWSRRNGVIVPQSVAHATDSPARHPKQLISCLQGSPGTQKG